MAIGLNTIGFNNVKKAVGVAAAFGSLLKKEDTLKDPGGDFGKFLLETRRSGISRNNKFSVIISMPPGSYLSPSEGVESRLSLYAIDVEVPTREIYTEATRIYGTNEELPVDYQFGLTFQMTFYADIAYRNLSYFDRWMSSIVDSTSNDIMYNNTYAGTVEVMVVDYALTNESEILKKPSPLDTIRRSFLQSFDPTNEKYADPVAKFSENVVAHYKYYGAYPKAVQIKKLSNNSKEFQEITVTFAYRKVHPTFAYANVDRYLPDITVKKPSFSDKLLGNATSKVAGFASTAGGVAGSIANIARIGG